MAARRATASVFTLQKVNWTLPLAVLDEILHSHGFRAGVYFVACTAGSALLLIYMNVMEVLVPVTEPRQSCGALIENQRFFMTLEA